MSALFRAPESPASPERVHPRDHSQRAGAPRDNRGGDGVEAELDRHIQAHSSTRYAVARSFVDELQRSPDAVQSPCGVVPHEDERGVVVGIKVYGIRRGRLLAKLGLQNGDLLRTINGHGLTTPDAARAAFAQLRSADKVWVAIVRRGAPLNLEYELK